MATKEFQERKALRALSCEPWEYDAKLYVGPATIARLLANAWIERVPDPIGQKKCKITDAGRAALVDLSKPKPNGKNRKPMKMLDPLIKIADTSIAKVRR
jgi:hypothetical protein